MASFRAKARPGAARPRPRQAVVSLTTPAVCHRDHSFFTELRKAHISCPVPEGDAPATLTFGNTQLFPASGYTESGFVVTATNSSNAIFDPQGIFSSHFLTFDAPNTTVTISSALNEVFSFTSTDLGLSHTSGGAAFADVTFLGTLAAGGTVSQTFFNVTALQNVELNWAGLTSLTVSGTADPGLDNMILNGSSVPEPSSALLIGLSAFGLVSRRRRSH